MANAGSIMSLRRPIVLVVLMFVSVACIRHDDDQPNPVEQQRRMAADHRAQAAQAAKAADDAWVNDAWELGKKLPQPPAALVQESQCIPRDQFVPWDSSYMNPGHVLTRSFLVSDGGHFQFDERWVMDDDPATIRMVNLKEKFNDELIIRIPEIRRDECCGQVAKLVRPKDWLRGDGVVPWKEPGLKLQCVGAPEGSKCYRFPLREAMQFKSECAHGLTCQKPKADDEDGKVPSDDEFGVCKKMDLLKPWQNW